MLPQLCFFLSIAFSFIAWGIVTARYIWPELRLRQRADALRPLLVLHSFRFMGLAFLVPGVVSPDLPPAFAHSAAYGDIIAAVLALLSLLALPTRAGAVIVWIFNLWGSADLLGAFYQGNASGLLAGQLGAGYFIPTFVVPLLLITHGLMFRFFCSINMNPPCGKAGIRPSAQDCPPGKSSHSCPAVNRKIFRFTFEPNHFYIHRRPGPHRGAFRDRHERRAGMRWTQAAR